MARSITLRPPAKINLSLRVGDLRPDGFHDVETVLQTIALSDTLVVTPRRGPLALTVRPKDLSADRTNLVWRAADLLWRASGREGEPRDARIALTKAIPMGAGLGGGSADAAAALVALNRVWGLRLNRMDLLPLAAQLGADVPFFLVGGTAMGMGRGDDLYPLQDISRARIVLIKPAISVSTADAYRWLDEDRAARTASLRAVSGQQISGWPSRRLIVANDFQEAITRRHAEVAAAIRACMDAGAEAAAMSGSGSAVFAMFSEAKAAKAVRQLRRSDWAVIATRTLSRSESGRLMGL